MPTMQSSCILSFFVQGTLPMCWMVWWSHIRVRFFVPVRTITWFSIIHVILQRTSLVGPVHLNCCVSCKEHVIWICACIHSTSIICTFCVTSSKVDILHKLCIYNIHMYCIHVMYLPSWLSMLLYGDKLLNFQGIGLLLDLSSLCNHKS